MHYLTAHSELGANILAKSGYILRRVRFVEDGFEYIFEVPSALPERRDMLPGLGLSPADHVSEGKPVVSIQILSDKSNAKENSSTMDKVLRVSCADALTDLVNLGQDFKGSLRLDFEGVFHDGTVIRSTIERQA